MYESAISTHLHKSQLAKVKSFLNPVLLYRVYLNFRDEKVEFTYL